MHKNMNPEHLSCKVCNCCGCMNFINGACRGMCHDCNKYKRPIIICYKKHNYKRGSVSV